jgi:hypothetical protein
VVWRNVRVEDAESPNDFAAGIRKQGKFDLVRRAEALQRLARIIRDARGVDAIGLQLR